MSKGKKSFAVVVLVLPLIWFLVNQRNHNDEVVGSAENRQGNLGDEDLKVIEERIVNSNLIDQKYGALFKSKLAANWIFDPQNYEDYFSIVTITSYMNYPATPDEVYLSHIDKAENGSKESMYKVSKAFHECSNGPGTRENFENHWLTNASLQSEWTIAEYMLERCETLSKRISESTSIVEQEEYWLSKSAESGFYTARAELLISETTILLKNDPLFDEITSNVENALKSEGYPAYYLKSSYIDRVAGVPVEGDLRSTAWKVAGCKLHAGCDQRKLIRFVTDLLLPQDQDEFFSIVKNIEDKYQSND